MKTRLHFLLWLTLLDFAVCVSVQRPFNRGFVSLYSARDPNRTQGKRAPPFLDDFPGSKGQALPDAAIIWTQSLASCNSTEMDQIVTKDGCQPRMIRNRFCFGVCPSVYVPGVPGVEEHSYCTQCRPTGKKQFTTVTLTCIGGVQKTIAVPTVEKCSCSPCQV